MTRVWSTELKARVLDKEKRALRRTLVAYIVEQAYTHGHRCPATQKQLTTRTSVLIKVHNPRPVVGKTWCVVDGFAYDCAVEDGTMRKITEDTVFKVEVIDGRSL